MIEAVLFDLGNVILEVDFRRTFARWAESAGVEVSHLHERWSMDEAYCAHETGNLEFEDYVRHLTESLSISMPLAHWEAGWNDVFVGPFPAVQARLGELAGTVPLFAFTNTNPTHVDAWRSRYFDTALYHFEEIFISSTMGMRKPDTLAYEWVADAMSLAPREILFLDDTLENIEGAAAVGMQTEWIRSEADVLRALRPF